MKFPYFPLFPGKRVGEIPDRHSSSDRSQHLLVSNRVLFIPLRSPSDQLQIVMFQAEASSI
jgi:hypothetical protein